MVTKMRHHSNGIFARSEHDAITDAFFDCSLKRSLARFADKSPETPINAPPCARQTSKQGGALNWVSDETMAITPMFVPHRSARTRTLRNKNGQKAYFCPTVSQPNAFTLGQTSQSWEKSMKKPIFVPVCSTCARANWNRHRTF